MTRVFLFDRRGEARRPRATVKIAIRGNSVLGAVALALLLAGAAPAFAESAEIAAIRDLQARQAEAWNRHDAAAYADLFTEDGDVVNVMGWWWRGRAEIRQKLSEAFAFVFKESRLEVTEVHATLLEPTVAVAHVRWTMEGGKAPPGAPQPPRQGIQLQVLRKTEGRWRIVSFQNTNSLPETPFPKGPPPPAGSAP